MVITTGVPIHLGPRLAAASKLVMDYLDREEQKGKKQQWVLADIGSDHAYLPAYLIQQDVIARAIAVDVHEGPYQNMLRTIELYALGNHLQARRGDGLATLKPGQADVVVAAGMGGATIEKILRDGAAVAGQAHCLVLQPQNAYEKLCRMLLAAGWMLAEEVLVEEGQEIYRLMLWQRESYQDDPSQDGPTYRVGQGRNEMSIQAWDLSVIEKEAALWREQACPESDEEVFAKCIWNLGPKNVARRDRLLLPLGRRELARLARTQAGLRRSSSEESERRRRSVADAIKMWEDLLKWLFP